MQALNERFRAWFGRDGGDTPLAQEEAEAPKAKPQEIPAKKARTVADLPPMRHPEYLGVHMANAQNASAMR